MAEKSSSRTDAARPRPFWSGVVAFGLVSLPVSLFPANRGKPLSLRMVDAEGTPLRRRYFCEQEERILDREEIVRGYPVDRDEFVLVEDAELQQLAPEKSREIDLRRFVPVEQVDPVFFERGYFLAPDADTTKAYRLLAKSLEEAGRAGIATFVMRDKEYLITLVAENGILRAETLRFHDEIRTPGDIGLPPLEPADAARVRTMRQAMEALSATKLDRALLTDRETQRLRECIDSKLQAGADVVEAPESAPPEETSNVVDLMQVLKERLRCGGAADHRARHDTEGADEALASLSRDQLYARAQQRHIPGRSTMSKQELVQALGQGKG